MNESFEFISHRRGASPAMRGDGTKCNVIARQMLLFGKFHEKLMSAHIAEAAAGGVMKVLST